MSLSNHFRKIKTDTKWKKLSTLGQVLGVYRWLGENCNDVIIESWDDALGRHTCFGLTNKPKGTPVSEIANQDKLGQLRNLSTGKKITSTAMESSLNFYCLETTVPIPCQKNRKGILKEQYADAVHSRQTSVSLAVPLILIRDTGRSIGPRCTRCRGWTPQAAVHAAECFYYNIPQHWLQKKQTN